MKATKKLQAATAIRKNDYALGELAGLLIDGTKRTHALTVAVSTIAGSVRGGPDILRHLIIELMGVAGEVLELAENLERAIAQQRDQ
jgi:hypothetical protein